jgi:hypothetical protein
VNFTAPAAYGNVLSSFPSTVPIGTGAGLNAQVGWESAIGVDYGFGGTPWHLSFDMRYGQANALGQALSASSGPAPGVSTAIANESLGERENHTVADIMFGREIGGPATLLKFGLRFADVGADIGESASLSTCSPSGGCSPAASSALLSADERSSFIGVGPRVSLEGRFPLANSAWAIEYLGGAAALIGERQFEMAGSVTCTTSASGSSAGVACTSTTTAFGTGALLNGLYSTQISDFTPVLNAEVSVALAYAFSPASHLSVGFRLDSYWDALKTVNSAGQLKEQDRLYYGPFVRLSTKF